MSNRNVYGNCWREHGSAFWVAFIRTGLKAVMFPGWEFAKESDDCTSAQCVVDDFGNLVIVGRWS